MGTSTNRPKPKPRQTPGKNGSGTLSTDQQTTEAAQSSASKAGDTTAKTTTGALPTTKKVSGTLPASSKTPTAKTATGSTTGKTTAKAAPPSKPPASISQTGKRDARREELSRKIEERRLQRERQIRNRRIKTGATIGGGAAVVIAIIIGIIVYVQMQGSQPAYIQGTPIDGITCGLEQSSTHYHAHLQIYVNGKQVPIPGDVGRQATSGCLYWLHVHNDTGDDGNIHIEAPADQNFTLHQFFDIWGQQLSTTNLLGNKVDTTHKLTVYVYNTTLQPQDGNTPFTVTPPSNLTPYTGDPSKIVLKPHELIFLEYGTPLVPPSAWTFLAGL